MMSTKTLPSATFACVVKLKRSSKEYNTGASIHLQGFMYWKEGPKAFKAHERSDCHHEAGDPLVVLP